VQTPESELKSARQELGERLKELMRRYQAADATAADELVGCVNPMLSRYFYTLSGNARHLDDVLQECWLRIHRARHSYRPGEPVLPWLFSIARHARVDHYRRWQRSSGRESGIDNLTHQPAADPRQTLEDSLQAQAILGLLDHLPAPQREVLMMLKMNDMSVEEIALATGSTIPAVKQKAYRAYQALRQALGLATRRGEAKNELRGI
jgi:RNA polymerase sigma-70 factor (ECF subfamily)